MEFSNPTLPIVPQLNSRFNFGNDYYFGDLDQHEASSYNDDGRRIPASNSAILGLREVSMCDDVVPAECAVCLQDFESEISP